MRCAGLTRPWPANSGRRGRAGLRFILLGTEHVVGNGHISWGRHIFSGKGLEGDLGGVLLGLALRSADAPAEGLPVHQGLHLELPAMVGSAHGDHLVLGRGPPLGLHHLLEEALEVAVMTPVEDALEERAEVAPDEALGRTKAPVQIDRGDDGLEGVGQDRVRKPLASQAPAYVNAGPHLKLLGDSGQALSADDDGLDAGEFAFGRFRKQVIEPAADHRPQDGVAQELQTLVGGSRV